MLVVETAWNARAFAAMPSLIIAGFVTNTSSPTSAFQCHIDFDGRIAAGVEDLARVNVADRRHKHPKNKRLLPRE